MKIEINSKEFEGLNIRPETTKLLEENVRKNLLDTVLAMIS